MACKVRRPLGVEPARHQTEVQVGILMGGQDVGGVESIGTVKMLADGV